MTNNVDKQYIDLLKDVLENGTKKADRTGVGTYSVFGRMMRFDMSEGFPLLTTKKIFTKAMFHELLWFIKGGDNIKYLVDNDVKIWNEWPYKKFVETEKKELEDFMKANPDVLIDFQHTTMEQFVQSIKEDKHYFSGEAGFAEKWGGLGPVYGKQWVDWQTNTFNEVAPGEFEFGSINQIDQVIDMLKNNPDSRRIMVSAWNPGDLPKQLLPPCHYAFQLWSRELTAVEREDYYAKQKNYTEQERMEMNPNCTDEDVHEIMNEEGIPKRSVSLMFQMRSVDCLLGMPFDIGSYAGLLTMIAHCTDMVPNELIVNSGDTHIYLNHIEQVKEQITRTHFKLPTISFNPTTKNIYEIKYEDFVINNYECHPPIKADVAV